MKPEHYYYRLAGLLIESSFQIADLPSIESDDAAVDVRFRTGSIHEKVQSPRLSLSWVQASANECLVTMPAIGRFFVTDGKEVAIEPYPEAAAEDLNPFLLGIVLGVLCHQRGLLALHANAIQIEDGCVAFVGPSGAGKSTLTGFLNERGYRMVTDDVCLIRFEPDRATVWPSAPRLKLWKNTLEALGHRSDELKRVLSRLDKYSLPVDQAVGELELRRVYVLTESSDAGPEEIRRITGAEAMRSLADNLYYPEIGWATRGEAIFTQCRTLLNTVECYRLSRPRGFNIMGAVIDRLEEHFATGNE